MFPICYPTIKKKENYFNKSKNVRLIQQVYLVVSREMTSRGLPYLTLCTWYRFFSFFFFLSLLQILNLLVLIGVRNVNTYFLILLIWYQSLKVGLSCNSYSFGKI